MDSYLPCDVTVKKDIFMNTMEILLQVLCVQEMSPFITFTSLPKHKLKHSSRTESFLIFTNKTNGKIVKWDEHKHVYIKVIST